MAKKKRKISPSSDMESQAVARFNLNKQSMDPRQFRDAITKVTGGIRGVPTQATQWSRWDK